jgi:serine phosphatase RsbU (regulator of sigma subunit)/putative methionine-R-sulfoxide reductase with GAF domain
VTAAPSAWRQIILLGEQLLARTDLAAQRAQIVALAARLFDASARLWLDERLFRLPGRNLTPVFPAAPSSEAMRRALETGTPHHTRGQKQRLAVPLKRSDLVMGALQLERVSRPFRPKELELLDGFAGHVALALAASHRFAVEQWRIEQLTLVRRVSAQIASVLDLDRLTRRVTKLIQSTFSYYYVAIFTLEKGRPDLEFRSSAGQVRARARRLKVRLGEGLIGAVAAAGEEAVANDVETEPRFKFIDSLPETRSEAVLPLKIEDQVLGVLDVQSDQLGAFHPNDLLVLRALADAIATAVNAALLYGELQARAEHLAMVAEVSDDITSTLELDELFSQVAGLIKERLRLPYVHLFTVHPNRRQIIYEAGSAAASPAIKGHVLDLDRAEGIIPTVAREGKTILANDVSREPRYRPSPFPPENARAELTIPLVYDGRVVGVLDLQSDRSDAFTEDHRFVCEALADNVAVAIRNADLYRTERWRRQVADSLREVAGSISAETGLEGVLESVLLELERSLPCDVSAIWLLAGEELYLAHVRGADMAEVEMAARRWPESYAFLASALAADEPVIRRPDDPIGPTGAARGFSADYSSIAACLRAGGRPLGVLTLTHHNPARYGHEAQAVTATFANYAAVAIENARMYDAAQEQAYASAALLQVAGAVATSNSLEETIGSIVRITPILVGVKGCTVYLCEGEHFHPTQSYGFEDQAEGVLTGRDFGPGDFPLLDAVRANARMVVGLLTPGQDGFSAPESWLDPELARSEQENLYALQSSQRLLIGLPLQIKGDLYGVMLVEEGAEALRFRQKRVEIVTSIAQQVALSVQSERLQREMVARERLEHEIHLARQIQRTFLPERLPEFPAWDLAATWMTAREVGGDFYDLIELPGGRLGMLIADVSDKGIPAALFMALTRTLVRAVVFETPSPAEVMRRVNALIIPDNQQGMFVTAVYGVLSLQSGEFAFANAGHNPPAWLRRRSGEVETLRRTGPALGIIQDLEMEERTISIGPGDLLLLYTDGLTEAFSPGGEVFGEDRLLEILRSREHASAREALETLEESVRRFSGPISLADDLTMLAIRRRDGAIPAQDA